MTHCYFLISRSSSVLQTFISNCWLIQVLSNDLQFYEKPFQCLYCVRTSRATLPAKSTRVNYLIFFSSSTKIQYYYLDDSMLTFQSSRQNTE